MQLRTASRFFFTSVTLALTLNLGLLLFSSRAQLATEHAVDRRAAAHAGVDELVSGVDLLASMVQGYTTTGQTRYLDVYYDILAVWHGEAAAPSERDSTGYWRELLASGDTVRQERPGLRSSVLDRFRALEFAPGELEATQAVLDSAASLQQIEKVAFAATQGLYDRHTQRFVDEGTPDRTYAMELVHSPRYESTRAELVRAVGRLSSAVDQRTAAELAQARSRQQWAVAAAIACNLLLAPLLVLALASIRRRVLQPIQRLDWLTERYAAGEYSQRTGHDRGWVAELATLGRTLDGMADAIDEDLRHRDAAQRELALARDQAMTAARTKSAFLANMSHEIRTPINAVMGMTHLALRTELSGAQRDYLEKSLSASEHLLQLINDVLDFSKIEAGGMTLEVAEFSIESVVSRSLAMVRQRAQEKGLELVCDFRDPTLLGHRSHVRGDALRLCQVLTNLMGNAVKFTAAGQVILRVDSEPASDPSQMALVLQVQDTGIGMSAEQAASLFREFSQADATITRRYGGTGLGLAISSRLVQLMGGRIEVRSQPGSGSCFSIHLSLPLHAIGPVAPCAGAGSRLKLLVVEDRADTLAALMALLQSLGISAQGRLVTAGNGTQALSAVQEAAARGDPFDAVLLDWVLPDMDGRLLLREIKTLAPNARLAVMSAYGSSELEAAAQAAGTELIAKPVLPNDLRRLFCGETDAVSRNADASARLDGLRVLLVEDNALNREVASGLLQQQGAEVTVAHHGLEALERLNAAGPTAYDVVLMDLQMPVLDGYQAVQQLRARHEFENLPLIAMTAHAMAGERERCLALGMQGYVTKPFAPAVLFSTLARFRTRPAAATQPTRAESDVLTLLPRSGLDVQRLLAHCGGNVSLATRLMQGFAADYAQGLAEWPRWLAQGQIALLGNAAHTLQGLAGTLGADDLRTQALAVERAAMNGAADTVAQLLPALDRELAVTVLSIQQAEPARPASSRPTANAGKTSAEPAPDLSELTHLLRDSDSRALDWWQRHQRTVTAGLNPVAARTLTRAMSQLDFDAALETLDRIEADEQTWLPSTPEPSLQ